MPARQKIILINHPVMVVVFMLLTAMARADTHYVAHNGQNPAPDYLDWTTAASNIQDAISVASAPSDTVLVTNGAYCVTSQVSVTSAITVRSVNG